MQVFVWVISLLSFGFLVSAAPTHGDFPVVFRAGKYVVGKVLPESQLPPIRQPTINRTWQRRPIMGKAYAASLSS
ncbi:uncharacterized protein STEHIDRAFT_121350 [Stereum hirsutum FP-91666 SS1]|uniref:uncharacterized protein n=1 Tax=Stereum hirsutum (strain FP-91666) TaxID=721885 RepID=UPI000440D8B8|nr:uncharacterized protein STEHIDRAFT_121350 [Stereum hirsutum FP-91666 SS1]EIM86363.1 hypothetical protein STEHIDRAFT_121350 [Stereum hirsutum FP-91666 SS1]